MANQLSAIISGIEFQHTYFWYLVAKMLNPGSHIESIEYEVNTVIGADDIIVNYDDAGLDVGGWQCLRDYYQVKYHVDSSQSYNSNLLIHQKKTHQVYYKNYIVHITR